MKHTLLQLKILFQGGSAILLLFLAGCTHDSEKFIRIINSRITEDHPLIYQVDVALEDTGDLFIEYFQENDTTRFYSELYQNKDTSRVNLIGLIPQTSYQYIVHAKIQDRTYHMGPWEFRTDSLPAGLPVLILNKDSYAFEGFILLKTFFDPGAMVIIDDQANIIWYHLYDQTTVRAFNLSEDEKILSLTDSSTIEYMDLFGNVTRRINTKTADVDRLHHDILPDTAEHTIGLSYKEEILDLSAIGGLPNDTIVGDGIVIFNAEGQKVWDWNIFDHLDPLEDDSIIYLKNDWSHANSINFDVDGHFLVSFRNFNQIWKINRFTGDVLWKAGINGDYISFAEGQDFIHQHDVHVNRFGHIMMFDNGMNDRRYSRILSIRLDEPQHRWYPVLNIMLDRNHQTFRMGSVRYIDDQHMLVSSPKRNMQISIITIDGEVVWNARSDKSSYRAIYLKPEIIRHKKWF
jgi:hypothetical protein